MDCWVSHIQYTTFCIALLPLHGTCCGKLQPVVYPTQCSHPQGPQMTLALMFICLLNSVFVVHCVFCLQDCSPSKTNRSVWLSSFGTSKNISNPTSFSSNESVFCSWKVYVSNGFRIRVHFNSFDVKNSSNCSQAAVEVAEKQGVIDTVLGRYCGSILPDDLVSTFSFVTLIYTASSGSTQTHPGFHASLLLAPAGIIRNLHQLKSGRFIV